MVKNDVILSTKTVSDEKDLNNIFGIENENISIVSTSLEIIDEKDVKKSDILNDTYFTNYYARKAIEDGLFDMETWNKIVEFEKNNPDKIRKWRDENEETRIDNYRWSKNCIDDKIEKENTRTLNSTKKISKTEQLIEDCIDYEPKNSFVISVKSQFEIKGYLSEKQIAILERILDKARIHEDL